MGKPSEDFNFIRPIPNMKTLRVITTYQCMRCCEGCCNTQEQFRPENVPLLTEDIRQFDKIILSGGEPLLMPRSLKTQIELWRRWHPVAKYILYTAETENPELIIAMLRVLDGLTVSLHEPEDVDDFYLLNFRLLRLKRWIQDNNKTLRLNVFRGLHPYMQDDSLWKIKKDIVWIPNYPPPPNETIRRL